MALTKETLDRQRLFRAAFFSTTENYHAMAALAKAWHFFDPAVATEEARYKRQCFVEILVMAGMWPRGEHGLDLNYQAFHAWMEIMRNSPQETEAT